MDVREPRWNEGMIPAIHYPGSLGIWRNMWVTNYVYVAIFHNEFIMNARCKISPLNFKWIETVSPCPYPGALGALFDSEWHD